MTDYKRLERVANLYIVSYRELKKINKEKEPERYDKCLELVRTAAMILKRNGVSIKL